jgi:hypothetical protein
MPRIPAPAGVAKGRNLATQRASSQVMHEPMPDPALRNHEYTCDLCIRIATLQVGSAHDGENAPIMNDIPAIANEIQLRTTCLPCDGKVPLLAAKLR